MGNKILKTTRIFDKIEHLKTEGLLIGPKAVDPWLITLGYQFDPSTRWNIVVSRFHLIDGF